MSKGHPLSDETKQEVLEYYHSGKTVKECTERFEVCGNAIYRILNENGIHKSEEHEWTQSKLGDAAADYYTQGHSVRETASQFSITRDQVNHLVKIRKLTNGKNWREAGIQYCRDKAKQRCINRLSELGFEYIGGYENKESRIKIRCLTCNAELERTAGSVYDGVRCIECQKKETRKREEARKRIAAQKAEELREQRIVERERAKAEKADALFHLLNDKAHVCSVCGEYFSISEFMESKGRKLIPTNPKYCSKECENKHNHRKSKECKRRRGVHDGHRHRAKKYGCAYDPTVTLPRLIKRDGLRCAICGEMCNPNDRSWSKYSGPTSPTIDHKIPMARGGGHVWENVQVAHMICNSLKRDLIGEEV